MSENSAISWTHHTFNPWWGCIEVSPACDNCYARVLANRFGHKVWGPAKTTLRRFFADKHWAEPLKWNAAAAEAGERRQVFCASMADVFERNEELEPHRARLWALIEATPHLDWLLLTKRPENILGMIPVRWTVEAPHNVWYGATAENQHYADLRIPLLLKVPAVVRFLSCEPLLGPVKVPFSRIFGDAKPTGNFRTAPNGSRQFQIKVNPADLLLHWVITGGESGHGARPTHPDWYANLRDQCAAAGIAYHHKQNGQWSVIYDRDRDDPDWQRCDVVKNETPQGQWLNLAGGQGFHGDRVLRIVRNASVKESGRLLDGREWNEFPVVAVAGAPA